MSNDKSPLTRLCHTMSRLRSPGGCPWDIEQTSESLKPYIVEETYELLDAIDSGDPCQIKEELGDLLLQVVFQADIHRQAGHFDLNDVIACIDEKLVRRHPHVFAKEKPSSGEDHAIRWERIKAAEKPAGRPGGILAGVPNQLPALQATQKIISKLRRHGHERAILGELDNSHEPADDRGAENPSRKLLKTLIAAVVDAEREGIDAEDLLRRHNMQLLDDYGRKAPEQSSTEEESPASREGPD